LTKLFSHRERLETCLAGGKMDRVPVSLWRHFPVDDQTPDTLAEATVLFQQIYDFDFVKVTPASSFCVKDWGVEDEWRGASEGTRIYTRYAVHEPEDWVNLPVLNPKAGHLGDQIHCLEMIIAKLDDRTPVVQTIFNPLSQAKNLVSRELLQMHLRKYPQAVLEGLHKITESTIGFIEEIKKTGVAGIFLAVQHAQYGLLSEQEYQNFGKNFDLQLLGHIDNLWLNILHLHGDNVMFDLLADYPISVMNWHDQETPPTLKDGKLKFQGVVCGGLQREKTIVFGSPEQVRLECERAIVQTGGDRFILGTGCVVPIIAPHGNIKSVRLSVESK
jgi:uroporphyrinogen decarboxylase